MLQNRQKKPTDGNETIWRCFLRWRNLIFEVFIISGTQKICSSSSTSYLQFIKQSPTFEMETSLTKKNVKMLCSFTKILKFGDKINVCVEKKTVKQKIKSRHFSDNGGSFYEVK